MARWEILREKTRVRYDDRIVLTVGAKMRRNLLAILAFTDEHSGPQHRLVVAHHGAEQTLACSCGMPTGNRVHVTASLVEEDVNDG
jgi:hypothetical protein